MESDIFNTKQKTIDVNDVTLFSDLYGILAEEYKEVDVTSLSFSVRLINCFKNNGIHSVADLLKYSPSKVMQIKGFGVNCLNDLDLFFKNASSQIFPEKEDLVSNRATKSIPQLILNNREKIAIGDFSFETSPDELILLEPYKKAHEIIDENILHDCYCNPQKIIPIINCFSIFSCCVENENKKYQELYEIVDLFPDYRKNNSVIGYITAYTTDEEKRQRLSSFCPNALCTFNSMIAAIAKQDQDNYVELKKFIKWCSFDTNLEISELFDSIYSKNNMKTVVQLRARHKTLEQVGSILGVTRERVRQIEAKAKRLFAQWQRNHRIVSKISAERNGDSILTPIEIEEFCNENATELLFFLKTFESSTYTYDAQLDVFIVGNESISERAQEYIENLPDIFNASNLPDIYEMAKECDDIPQELLEKAISSEYRQTGETYHRCKLSLSKMYSTVLKEHYPNGIKAYDENELITFRRHVISTYGNVKLPDNNRAITARIAGICVLCGKGKYKPKAEKYLSNKLLEKIYRYIIESKISIFLTNTLFFEFEDELVSEGVNNKYFLQGILHEMFGDKFVFHRDYVSKDDSFTSIYSEIITFIKQSDYPISKKQIQNAFPGITDIVLSLAVSDPCILNYFGEYLHSSKLKLLESDKRYLGSVITNTVKDNCAHHFQELYSIINLERPEIFTRNAAESQFSAYSILEYLYHNLFQFSRPYIALNEVEIGRPGERLHDLIYSSDEYVISEISEFARENHFQITSLLDYLNACNDSYFIANCDMLLAINSTSVTKEISQIIENMIYNEIDQTTPIFQLKCLSQFPTLDVPWTDWLIYSILKKWAIKIDVGTSSKQFRYAVPLVARHEQLCVEGFINLTRSSDELVIADDLENIDDLISGYIENEVIL